MKLILIWVMFFSLNSFGQDCKTLNQLNSFHGLKFGEVLPDSLLKKADTEIIGTIYLDKSEYKDYKNPLRKFFRFTNDAEVFDEVALSFDSEKRLYSVYLWNPINSIDSIELSDKNYPTPFLNIQKEIISLFGKATKLEDQNDYIMGNSKTATWECDRIRIELTFNYPAIFPKYSIEIIDKLYEKAHKINKITN